MTVPIPREHFLPANATPFETSLSETLARIDDVPVPIDKLWNPWECPVSHLPFLAWALSVDFWKEDWPEHRKRQICADSFEAHKQKGTLAGIRKYLNYADDVLVEAITPPQAGFLGKKDDEAIDRWRAGLPRIEIRPYVNNVDEPAFALDADFLDDGFLDETRIGEYVGRRAFYVYEGQETEIQFLSDAGPFTPDGVERFGLPSIADWRSFYLDDGALDLDHLGAGDEILAEIFGIERAGLGSLITAGIKATSVVPEIVPIDTYAHAGEFYLDDGFVDSEHIFTRDYVPDFFERFYLYIKGKTTKAPQGPFAYLDETIFGWDAYTAELKVEITDTTDDGQFLFLDDGFLDVDGITTPDFRDLWEALDAIYSAKSARDKIVVNTAVHSQVKFGQAVMGEFKIGEYRRD